MKKALLFFAVTFALISITLLASKVVSIEKSSTFRGSEYINYEKMMIESGQMNWQDSECFVMKNGKLTIK